MDHRDLPLDPDVVARLLEVGEVLSDALQTLATLVGAMDLGRRDLERVRAILRELSPPAGPEKMGLGS